MEKSDANLDREYARPPAVRVAFLYNHDVPHQVPHTAPILKAMLERDPARRMDVLSSTEAQSELVRLCLGEDLCRRVRFVALDSPATESGFLRAANVVLPAKRILTLKNNLDIFRKYDVLVVPESTSLMLRTRFGLNHLKFILTHHGAGDRAVTHKEAIRHFDFVLVSGEKKEKRHLENGLIRAGQYAMVGYPKFDFVDDLAQTTQLFDNDNPVVLYNPHVDPGLSSWFDMGAAVLKWFADRRDYNLIFAPHIMLFQRRVHFSLEARKARLRGGLPRGIIDAPNIHIDLGSLRSVDMSYTRAADIYLGDVSSQVYEFLENPRPCIFLDAHKTVWQGDPSFAFWALGPVLRSLSDLGPTLDNIQARQAEFIEAQNAAILETFALTDQRSSDRAACAINTFLLETANEGSHLEAAQ